MPPTLIRALVAQTGRSRLALARLMEYRSEHSLRQCEEGRAQMSDGRTQWLQGYAALRARHAAEEAEWLRENRALLAK